MLEAFRCVPLAEKAVSQALAELLVGKKDEMSALR